MSKNHVNSKTIFAEYLNAKMRNLTSSTISLLNNNRNIYELARPHMKEIDIDKCLVCCLFIDGNKFAVNKCKHRCKHIQETLQIIKISNIMLNFLYAKMNSMKFYGSDRSIKKLLATNQHSIEYIQTINKYMQKLFHLTDL